MATTISSPSSSLPDDDDNIPTVTLALPSFAAASASASRRLPPPCWTPEETVALIHAYKDKWFSLRRGNLRANHWQEVADDVASRCPADPPKTAVQCRHKMEKLRKRYRAEIQRAAPHGGARRFTSSWAHFQNMHAMEKGTSNTTFDDEDEQQHKNNSIKRINDLYSHHSNPNGFSPNQNPVHIGSAPAFRITIPGGLTARPAAAKVYSSFDEIGGQNPQSKFTNSVSRGYGSASQKGFLGKRRVAVAIEALGEGFMRMEKVKMEMVREIEKTRMEMELKRTEMLLELQQKIVDEFAKAISEKKAKKNGQYASLLT